MNIINFIYDYFYDVLSQEGIWVLILIGAGFAVASFILLTMRTETGFKYRDTRGNAGNLKKLNNNTGDPAETTEGIEDLITSAKPEKAKKSRKNKDTTAQPSVSLRPEMVSPVQSAPEVSIGVIDGLDITGMGSFGITSDSAPDGAIAGSAGVPAAPPDSSIDPEKSIVSSPVEADSAASLIDPFAIGADLPQPDQEIETSEEENSDDTEQPKNSDDIFAIFDEVDDEEQSETAMFAQELDDVTMDQMLSETESISQDLKNIFNQFRRA